MYEVEDIGNIIEQAGLGTIGTDIFLYHAPPEAKNCIIVFPSNDPPPIDPERPFYMKAKLQTIVRNSRYQEGLEVCKQIQDALTFFNRDVTLMKIKECRPLFQPRVYRRSESGDLEFSLTFQLTYIQK